jgi:hypothetical protein
MTTTMGFIQNISNTASFANFRFSQPRVEGTGYDGSSMVQLGVLAAYSVSAVTVSKVVLFEPVVRQTTFVAGRKTNLGAFVGLIVSGASTFTFTYCTVQGAMLEVPSGAFGDGNGGGIGGVIGFTNSGVSVTNNSISATITGNGSTLPAGGIYALSQVAYTRIITDNSITLTTNTGGAIGGVVGGVPHVATIKRNAVTGTIMGGTYTGGIVGYDTSSTSIYEANSISGTVTGVDYVGGMFGSLYWENGTVLTQHHSPATVQGRNYVGGLAGSISARSTIGGKSFSTLNASGTVTATGTAVGGLIGGLLRRDSSHVFSLDDSFASGNVTGQNLVGGLIGFLGTVGTDGSGWDALARVGSTGTVTATSGTANGLVGGRYTSVTTTTTNAFWDTQSTGQSSSGLASGATGLTTTAMKTQANLTGWDFTVIWKMHATTGYPALRFITP